MKTDLSSLFMPRQPAMGSEEAVSAFTHAHQTPKSNVGGCESLLAILGRALASRVACLSHHSVVIVVVDSGPLPPSANHVAIKCYA